MLFLNNVKSLKSYSLLRPNFNLQQNRTIRLLPKLPKLPSMKLKDDPPGNIVGTVNDAFVPPVYTPPEGSFHWAYEKITTVSMIPLMIFPFYGGVDYPLIDAACSTLLLIHCRYGFQSCIIDYIPLRRFQNWHKLAMHLLNLGTLLSMYGVYNLEVYDNGFADLIVRLWTA